MVPLEELIREIMSWCSKHPLLALLVASWIAGLAFILLAGWASSLSRLIGRTTIVFVVDAFRPFAYGPAGDLNGTIRHHNQTCEHGHSVDYISHGDLVAAVLKNSIQESGVLTIRMDVSRRVDLSEEEQKALDDELGQKKSQILLEAAESTVDYDRVVHALRKVGVYARLMPRKTVIVNMSLGSYHDNPALESQVQNLLRRGVTVVAALGNDDTDVPVYPAAYQGVVGVAAASPGTGKARYSNYGRHTRLCAEGTLNHPITLKGRVAFNELSADELSQLARHIQEHEGMAARIVEGLQGIVLTRRAQIHVEGTSFAAPRVSALLADMALKGTPPHVGTKVIARGSIQLPGDTKFREELLGAGVICREEAIEYAREWNPSSFLR